RVVDGRELEGLEWIPLPAYGAGAVVPPPPNSGSVTRGSGVYEEVKRNAINNYNGIMGIVGSSINNGIAVMSVVSTTGIAIGNRVLNSEGDSKAKGGKTKNGKTEKETGSYTNTHKSGKKYHGKGDRERAKKSGNEKAKQNEDPLESTEWTKAENDREAFKQESERLDKDAEGDKKGHQSDKNYNKRDSPGKKYREQDEQKKLNNNN
uniref:hypothetical protein n=1 Tax=Chryseobacterium sp. c4a TaxID=1573582 RepID=UPI001E635A6F